MTNLELVQKLMRETYGLLEVSSEVSAASVEFAARMAAELDARDNKNPLPANEALAIPHRVDDDSPNYESSELAALKDRGFVRVNNQRKVLP